VIPFQLDFNPKDLTKVKYSQSQVDNNGVTNKTSVELPVIPMNGSKSMLLHVIEKFQRAINHMQWTTGPTLCENFGKQFKSMLEWDVIAAAHANLVAGFQLVVTAHIATKFLSDAWQRHKTMLQSIKKPFKLSPTERSL